MAKRKLDKTIYIDMLMGRKSLIKGFTQLKKENSNIDIEMAVKKFIQSTTKSGEEFRQILFPVSYNQLWTQRLVFPIECDLKKELFWGKTILLSCARKICSFQNERRIFENNILLGRYEEAKEEIEKIKKEFGCSLWSMQQEFLLCELHYGLEANKKFLNELNSCLESPWLRGFADFFSMKAERNLNMGQYLVRIDRRLRQLSDAAKVYFKMHLIIEVTVENIDWNEVLRYANFSSIIDYYLDYCKICSYIICDKNISEDIKTYVRNLLGELSTAITDPVLEKLSFRGEKFSLTENEMFIQKIGDYYTEGKYGIVIDQCKNTLKQKANVFEIYEYYIKSCIISGEVSDFSLRTEENTYLNDRNNQCLKDILLDVLYAVYQKSADFEIAFDEIWVLMRYLNGFAIAPELYNFYLKKVAYYFSDFWKRCLEFQGQYHNMRNCSLYEDILRERYIDAFEKQCAKSSILELYRTNDLDEGKINHIDNLRCEWYRIKLCAQKANYNEALNSAVIFRKNENLYIQEYLKEDLSLFIFEMKVQLNMYLEALEMLVDIYMENKYMAMRINTDSFFKKIKVHTNNEIKKSIAMPILSYIVNTDDCSKVFVDYANYMNGNGFMKVHDLLESKLVDDTRRVIFFLRYICSVDILDTMYWAFYTQEEVWEERIFICQTLRKLDPTNEQIYVEEIGNITQRQNLSNDIRYLEEQKIDFDMEKIHNNYLPRFSENFKRYKELGKIWQDIQGINVIRNQDLIIYTYIVEDNETENCSINKRNQKFNMFGELFYEMRDEAAFGQMGLDQSLGTRIRHGRLQNQIRHVFEQKNIIFIKKDDNSLQYIPVDERAFEILFDAWNMEEKQVLRLHQIITEFTQIIDSIVTEINRELIRIRTENEYPEGIIDMMYTSRDIFELFNEGGDYENAEIMMELFEKSILNRIRTGLQSLNTLFQNEIKARYIKEINILEEKLRKFYGELDMEFTYNRVRSNLIQCRTEIQRELETISQWFRLPTSQEHPNYYMKDLMATCTATMRNVNARFDQATIEIEDATTSLWKGRTFSYFNEILVILFNNAFCHAGYNQNPEELKINLHFIENDNMLQIKMLTNLSEEVNVEEVEIKTRVIRDRLRLYANRVYSKDSGSGYIKIMNMLHNYITSDSGCWINFGVEKDKKHFFTDLKIDKIAIVGEASINETFIN